MRVLLRCPELYPLGVTVPRYFYDSLVGYFNIMVQHNAAHVDETGVGEHAGETLHQLPHLQPDGLTLSVVWPRRKQFLPKVDALLSALNELAIR